MRPEVSAGLESSRLDVRPPSLPPVDAAGFPGACLACVARMCAFQVRECKKVLRDARTDIGIVWSAVDALDAALEPAEGK